MKVVNLRPSPNEEARLLREERERRRKLRIQQVLVFVINLQSILIYIFMLLLWYLLFLKIMLSCIMHFSHN